MTTKVLKAIPRVFSLRGNDYSRFVVEGGAAQLMADAWIGVGARMGNAIVSVNGQILQEKKNGTKRHGGAKEAA